MGVLLVLVLVLDLVLVVLVLVLAVGVALLARSHGRLCRLFHFAQIDGSRPAETARSRRHPTPHHGVVPEYAS